MQLNATHSNLKQYVMELRLDLHTSIAEVKRKLYTHNGTSIAHMELHLRDGGQTIAIMADDARPLGYYGARNGMEVHVVDTDPHSLSRNGGLDDVTQIEKFRMTDEAYDARPNTLRAFKKKKQAEDPNFRLTPEARARAAARAEALAPEAYASPACVDGIAVGARVEIRPGARRGIVAWVGTGVSSLAAGYWVGVRLDEPLGRGDGSRGGVVYFECPDKYGAFVRPNFVSVGEYPPSDDITADETRGNDGSLDDEDAEDDDTALNTGPVACDAACTHGETVACEPRATGPGATGSESRASSGVSTADGASVVMGTVKAVRAPRRRGELSDDDDDEL